ncbi:hypothetical protein NCCP2495_30120 [Dietzia sp. NCCP-2495]|nr:hypothetical protein NCCP2495_30120 [Dietzia sp. NCCP-2495]
MEFAGAVVSLVLAWILLPVLGRIGGALLIIVGSAATLSHEPWAGWTIATGAALWLSGSWLHALKTSRYSSILARILFEHTPLKWTLWQHWARARRSREAARRPHVYVPSQVWQSGQR